MSPTAVQTRNVQAVEKCLECQAIAREIRGLIAEDEVIRARECSIHGLIIRRAAQLEAEQRDLAGLLDGVGK